jgi:hypothetical protein
LLGRLKAKVRRVTGNWLAVTGQRHRLAVPGPRTTDTGGAQLHSPLSEKLTKGEGLSLPVGLDVNDTIARMGVKGRHGTGGWINPSVRRHRNLSVVDHDCQFGMIVLGRSHLPKVEPGVG